MKTIIKITIGVAVAAAMYFFVKPVKNFVDGLFSSKDNDKTDK